MSTSPFSTIRFIIIFSIGWLVLMADHAIVLYWLGLPVNIALADSAISNIILLLACLLAMNTFRYYLPKRDQYINILALCVMLAILWLLLSKWLLHLLLGNYIGYEERFYLSIPIRFSIAFLILSCITMLSLLWYKSEEQKQNEARKADAEKLAREAELFKLRQQLQPHFLFNSLNSISALAGSQPEKARNMIQQLSEFLRGTLRKEEQQLVPLQEEIVNLQLYLDIEKVRFGHRLQTSIITDEETASFLIPPLLLQPVVENAIKFGLYDTIETVQISLFACIENGHLAVTVTNPYDPETSVAAKGTGFGLASVQRRLFLLYARNDLLKTTTEEKIFTTRLLIPKLINESNYN